MNKGTENEKKCEKGDRKIIRSCRINAKVCHLYNAFSLNAHGVLVDADGHFVLQDAAGPAADGAQVIGHEKRSGHNCPQSHLRTRLVHAEAKVANNQLCRSKSHKQRR